MPDLAVVADDVAHEDRQVLREEAGDVQWQVPGQRDALDTDVPGEVRVEVGGPGPVGHDHPAGGDLALLRADQRALRTGLHGQHAGVVPQLRTGVDRELLGVGDGQLGADPAAGRVDDRGVRHGTGGGRGEDREAFGELRGVQYLVVEAELLDDLHGLHHGGEVRRTDGDRADRQEDVAAGTFVHLQPHPTGLLHQGDVDAALLQRDAEQPRLAGVGALRVDAVEAFDTEDAGPEREFGELPQRHRTDGAAADDDVVVVCGSGHHAISGVSHTGSTVPMFSSQARRYSVVAQATSSTGMPPTE